MSQQQDAVVAGAARRGYWREADARVVVEAWRQSGASVTEFAALYGIDPKRVTRWARRLPASESVQFHPVRLIGHTGAEADRFEVVLANGRCLRLPQRFAPSDLRFVLDALEGRV